VGWGCWLRWRVARRAAAAGESAGSAPPDDASDVGVAQLELRLATAQRQIRDLRDQLAWQAKLLAAQRAAPGLRPGAPAPEDP
jgi:hypothetical protein